MLSTRIFYRRTPSSHLAAAATSLSNGSHFLQQKRHSINTTRCQSSGDWGHGSNWKPHNSQSWNWRNSGLSLTAVVAAGTSLSVVAYLKAASESQHAASVDAGSDQPDNILQLYGKRQPNLPEYCMDDIAKHASVEDRVWVCFNNGVYDITDFIIEHPGGDKIMLGAGGSVEPFWALYAVHKSHHVLKMLEKYRIGNLKASEVNQATADMTDPYITDPKRHPILKPFSKTPFNAEPPPSILVDSLYTPNEIFYVRNHLPVPVVEESEYELEVEGVDMKEISLSLEDLKKLPKYTVTSAIQCGGNRRSEMIKVKPVKGLGWNGAAISNAKWSGARLRDVLKMAGLDEEKTSCKHVQFEGLDLDPTSHPFGASIPLWKAMDPRGDVLLAYEMNGAPLPPDHGYPVRVVVPGVVGVRNVKWLGRIIVSEEESQSHWQQRDYKGFSPNIDWNTVDFSKSPAIQEMPVTSLICDPSPGEAVSVKDGKITVRGYAYSGGGRKIVRVDISSDGGASWREVDALTSDDSEHPRAWGWTLWRAEVAIPPGATSVKLVAKAVDSQYNTQPENFENIWNLRGVLSHAYHRITVYVK